MSGVNFLTRWKIQLDSNDKKMQTVALTEILECFSNLTNDYEDIYVILINSDISHFLSQILNYQNRVATCLINKIVCSLSETYEFFKNDFFLILKGYLRVISSFPTTASKRSENYHQDIFKTLSIILKRARERDCKLHDERITCLILNVFGLNKVHLMNYAALELINLTIELMASFPAEKEKDIKSRNVKLHEVLRSLSTKSELLTHQHFILILSKVLHNAINLIPTTFETMTGEFKLIRAAIIDNVLAVMDFILQENIDSINYEIFINLFFYCLTSNSFKQKHKMKLLNRLFILNGHSFLLTVATERISQEISEEITRLKSRLVMAEVLQVFVEFISKSFDVNPSLSTRCYEIMLKSRTQMPIEGELQLESMIIFIFMRFIDFTWKNPRFDKSDVLSNVSLILTVTRDRNEILEPAFTKMLTTLFTSTFIYIPIRKNYLLKLSSRALLESPNSSQIDLNYLRWWFSVLKPKKDVLNEVITKFLNKLEPGTFDNLQPSDAEMFDQKLVMKMFLDSSTRIKLHYSLSQVLCNFTSIESKDYQKLLDNFKVFQIASCKRKHRMERWLNVIDVMNAGAESLVDMKIKQETAKILSKTLHQPSSSPHVKLGAIQIATNLLSVRD